ncbi:MAG: amino acid adenylation domain-containing protein [Pseudomonadota bacterium]
MSKPRQIGHGGVFSAAHLSIVQSIELRARLDPESCALVFDGGQLSYSQLNRRANRLARHLSSLGVGAQSIVGVCAARGAHLVLALLAVWKAGGAYLPLDPSYPAARLNGNARAARASVILGQAASRAAFADGGAPFFDLEIDAALWEGQSGDDLARAAPASDLAYLIFTSGSTGQAKGVMIEQGQLASHARAFAQCFGLAASDRVLQFAGPAFDVLAEELWPSLACGATVVIAPPAVEAFDAFEARLERERITLLNLPATFWHAWCDHLSLAGARSEPAFAQLRQVIVGSEVVHPQRAHAWQRLFGSRVKLANAYGPTETCITATVYQVPVLRGDEARLPIGHPLPGAHAYVLDGDGAPVAPGVAGELYIGGERVARGYLAQAELTSQKFLPDRFDATPGARMYATGDQVCELPDGSLDYLGRIDTQIKLRGFRIEAGEIEVALRRHLGVRDAVVVARAGAHGALRLIAYLVTADAADAPARSDLQAMLAQELPAYMVPACFVMLQCFPVTPNGKVDRAALPEPQAESAFEGPYNAPQGELETWLAQLWCGLLKLERIGRDDDFFACGGHSMLAIALIERLRERALHIDVRTLFLRPTIAALAQALAAGQTGATAVAPNGIPSACARILPSMLPLVALSEEHIERIAATVPGGHANIQDIYPLGPLQEGILFHHMMAERGDLYLDQSVVRFAGRAELDAYVDALQAVIARHDILRTAVLSEGLPEPVQVVWRHAALAVKRVSLDPAAGALAAQLRQRYDRAHFRLPVSQAPIMRLYIARDTQAGGWLMLTLLHHLVGDHTTLELMQEEIAAHLEGRAATLPRPLPFREYIAQTKLALSRAEHETYFRAMLADVDEPCAPFGLLNVQGDGSDIAEARLELDAPLALAIRQSARRLGVTPASVFHQAWAQVVARTCGRDDVVFGTVLFGRMQGGDGADRVLGLFINTLPIRIKVACTPMDEALRTTHRLLAGLLRHEHAPLALAQRTSGVAAPHPLFSSLLNYRYSDSAPAHTASDARAAWRSIDELSSDERTNYPLTLSVDDLGQGFRLVAQVRADLGAERICAFVHTALTEMLAALDGPACRIDVLPAAQSELVLRGFNNTATAFPDHACIHELFEAQAARTPLACALVFEQQSLSYRQLDERSNQLAHHLQTLGVGPETLVGVCLERGIDMLPSLLAVLKAGAAYVPIDPDYPLDRIAYLLEDTAAPVVLTHSSLRARLPAARSSILCLDSDAKAWQGLPTHKPSATLSAGNLAYVIYTSGSTGRPKGAMNAHRAVVNRLCWMQQQYGLDAHDRVLQKTPYSFDVSVWEFFWPLISGATLVVAKPDGHRDSQYLASLIEQARITTIHFVPSMLQAFVAEAPRCGALRRVICSGEALPAELTHRFQALMPEVELHNLYGPTECAVDVTAWAAPPAFDGALVPIGRPIANTALYVLDQYGQAAPVGVAGELHIGGVQVGRGYLNQPALTAEKFIRDPFSSAPEARLYKTGDLARWLGDGNIEYLGRIDFQVKLRGFRIELGEIEHALCSHPQVREAVVLAREDVPGDMRLVAYLVGTAGAPTPSPTALREHLKSGLPEHMVPSAFVELEALPLTANGKLDRKALPAPHYQDAQHAIALPSNAVETAVAEHAAQVLNLTRLGMRDDFFALGGHSLLATQLVSRLRQALAVELPLKQIFDTPVIADLARAVQALQTAPAPSNHTQFPALSAQVRNGPVAASFAQERLWFLDQLDGAGAASALYLLPGSLHLDGLLDRAALERALQSLVTRHESLRTGLVKHDGQAMQVIAASLALEIPYLDLSSLSATQREATMRERARAHANYGFDLACPPLIRVALLKLAEREHVLLINMHHSVSDGWSLRALAQQLCALYLAYAGGQDDPLPPLPLQYADYAAWQRMPESAAALERQLAYWRGQLAGLPALLALPTTRPRPAVQSHAGARHRFTLEQGMTTALHALSRQHGATLFMTLNAAFSILLGRHANASDIAIGTPIANRNRRELEDLIGFFANTLVLRTDLSGAPNFAQLLGQVKHTCLQAYAHQDAPFEQVVGALNPERSMAHSPLFQAMLVVDSIGEAPIVLPQVTLRPFEADPDNCVARFDLTLSIVEQEDALHAAFEYSSALFDHATIARMAGHFCQLLEGIIGAPTTPITQLSMLTAQERHQLLYQFNDTATPFPLELCAHQLFEDQAARTPSAIALRHGTSTLSYAKLNARANQLARHLQTMQIGPGSLAGICVERGLDMVVAMLAVMKAGAAYVPIDPSHPPSRIAHQMTDARLAVLLTESRHLPRLADGASRMLCLDCDHPSWAGQSIGNLDLPVAADDLAYVIYTSGSSGKPKGTLLPHRGLSNLVLDHGKRFGIEPGCHVLQFISFSFDPATAEILFTLAHGATLVLAGQTQLLPGPSLNALLRAHEITHVQLPAPALACTPATELPLLRVVVTGGEACSSAIVDAWAPGRRLINAYGPSETTVCATSAELVPGGAIVIGSPIANTQTYVLDGAGQAAPIGVAGELHIGGVQVGHGYMGQAALTDEKFIADPFSAIAGARLYRSGDLARWLADGTLEYLGRMDSQVKIRGFRVELGEIEQSLCTHQQVRTACVVARADGAGQLRLAAYVVLDAGGLDASTLRAHLAASLPEHMIPAAFVSMDALPLTPNGKIDRAALPEPDTAAFTSRSYEAPRGDRETALARIWSELLGHPSVGRHDNFFELGGHSLLAVRVVEAMRRQGFEADVRALFQAPTVSALALLATVAGNAVAVPPNGIPRDCIRIEPAMLPLVVLTRTEIAHIAAAIPGGEANIGDIYPLLPLQEGILFHHRMHSVGDAYLLSFMQSFDRRARLDAYLHAFQGVCERHDVLRTAVLWDDLAQPVQVVLRKAVIHAEHVTLDPAGGDMAAQMRARFDPRHFRIDVRQAPLQRMYYAFDAGSGRWLLLTLLHHLAGDHMTLDVMRDEIAAHMEGRAQDLPPAPQFRNQVAQAMLGVSDEEHERFFRAMLSDVDTPTAPFGLLDNQAGASGIIEARLALPPALAQGLRECARRHGISTASVCHLGWAIALARLAGRADPVFGTVLLGRMQGAADIERAMGLFINTLPLRLHVGADSVADSLRATHALLADLMRHEHASLTLAQRCSAVSAPNPLFTSIFNYRHDSAARTGQAWEGIEELASESRTSYPLALAIDDLGDGFEITAQAAPGIAAERVCDYLLAALEGLIDAAERAPDTACNAIDPMPAGERVMLLERFNATETSYLGDVCVHQLVEQQALRTPQHCAVVMGDETLSYAQLNERANALAHHLRAIGVGPGTLAAVCMERGFELITALLAVLKAGAAYVPIDPAYPRERIAFQLDDTAAVVILTEQALMPLLPKCAAPILCVDRDTDWSAQSRANPVCTSGAGDLAYVIYTSGSTGKPKGVMVEHRALRNFLLWKQEHLQFTQHDRILQKTAFAFDGGLWEFWSPLLCGAQLVFAEPGMHADPAYLVAAIRRHGITTVKFIPAMLAMVCAEPAFAACGTLRHVICGGEALPYEVSRQFLAAFPHLALHNLFGPTETTIDVTAWTCRSGDATGQIPIGRPIANTQAYVLDQQGRLAPQGVAGELHIGGIQLARGYLNQPALTAERFVANPFRPNERVYKTGDLARWRADGNLDYLGRIDFQVKIRGYRIELGEIEHALCVHPEVREALVLARMDEGGNARLIAFVLAPSAPSAQALREHLKLSLPDHMVPAAFVSLDAWPLTENGKIDRKALPDPQVQNVSGRAPRTPSELALVEHVAALCHVASVSIDDHFFELGGHSLLATQLVSRLRKTLKVELPLKQVFATPLLHELAAFIDTLARDGGACTAAIARASRSLPIPASFAQERLWFLDQLERQGSAQAAATYLMPGPLHLHGQLDVDCLRRALERLVERHEILRTALVEVNGQPIQRILPATAVHLPQIDLHDLPKGERAAAAQRHVQADAVEGFDLDAAPLVRFALLTLAPDEHILLVNMHHCVSDGWSRRIFVQEIKALYGAFLDDRSDPLAPLALQYADYAAWQRGAEHAVTLERQLAYWKDKLATLPALLSLPTDRPRPAIQTYTGAYQAFSVAAPLTRQLKALSQEHGASLFMTLYAAFAVLLARHANQSDIAIGTPIANRNRDELENLIGCFANTLVLRINLGQADSFASLLAQVKHTCLQAYAHQDTPFEQLVSALNPERSMAHSPLFQVMLSLDTAQHAPPDTARLRFDALDENQIGLAVAKFDLSLSLCEHDGVIDGAFEYNTDLFDGATIERMASHLHTLLTALAAQPQCAVATLPMMSSDEHHLVAHTFNDTAVATVPACLLHELFEQQAARTPNAPALVGEGFTLSYFELNQRANQLAHRLLALGVAPDDRVAICIERSIDMIVAMLAVLKAGACYVPLDPVHPSDRLAYMLADCAPRALLTHSTLQNSLALFAGEAVTMPVLALDIRVTHQASRDHNPGAASRGLDITNLAYVLYTSGSTGMPKGVMIEHRNVVNLVASQVAQCALTAADRVLQFASFGFDNSIAEIFPALSVGATVVLRPADLMIPDESFVTFLAAERITVTDLPTAFWHLWADEIRCARCIPGNSLRLVAAGGEKAELRHLASWLAEPALANCAWLNTYGPTEATVNATTIAYQGAVALPLAEVPIGRPIANTQIHILDTLCQPVPLGVAGEIHIGGAGVARGYLNREELTAERFIRDPFSSQTDARMYKTGDLGRWLPDGSIEYLGRNDFQVKIRGFRIELGEIEAKLAACTGVREALVLAREDQPGEKRLVAYIVARGAAQPSAAALRAELSASLADYMLPTAFVVIPAFPLNANGKIDRKALPVPDLAAVVTRQFVAPASPIEAALAGIWQNLLGLEQVGRHDHFFELGGHSLMVTQLIARVRRTLGLALPLRTVFETPSLADIAAYLQGLAAPPVDATALRAQIANMSEAQIRALLEKKRAGAPRSDKENTQ